MQVRCQNCGAGLSVPAEKVRKLKCPRCGVMVMLPTPGSAPEPEPPGSDRKSRTALKRVYEPIPRPVIYLAGAGLALLLTSPFWIYVFSEPSGRDLPILPDETVEINVPPLTNAVAPSAPLLDERESGTLTFDRFRGVQLDAGRDDLQRRFNLRLQNTRGMAPEIYEAERVGEIEQLLAYFYGNALKEFSMLMRERRNSPDELQQELVAQFGEPQQVQEFANTARALGLGLPGTSTESAQKYPRRRHLTWADKRNRIDATIYYNMDVPAAPSSVLSVRITAVAWLAANHPVVGSTPSSVPSALERPVLPSKVGP